MTKIRPFLLLAAILYVQTVAGQDFPPRLAKPDDQGRNLYIIELVYDVVGRADIRNEAPTRSSTDRENATDFRGWHRPQVRATVKELEAAYSIQARTMTSYVLPSFSAYVSEAVVERLRADPRVSAVLPTYSSTSLASWSDQTSGGEIIPWGKTAIGTNDAISTTNRVYMIDGGPIPANNDLVNIEEGQVNLNVPDDSPGHATHVAGILSAAMNSAQTRGVNPGAAITTIKRGDADDLTRQAMDWVLIDAESKGIYGVLNFSLAFSANDPGNFKKFFRHMSNRMLVVQSAGNRRDDACVFAYGPPSPADGILVVGAIDELGQQAIPTDNSGVPGYGVEPGSNVGSCVEVWAPGQRVFSTWNTSSLATQVLSGTSMAAPHISALAARFGTIKTTPVEREHHIRARLTPTGFTDEVGTPILVPSFIQPPSFTIPTRLRNLKAQAESTLSGSPANTHDGLYVTGNYWNSGVPAPTWIEFDLIYPRALSSIRLSPEQTPSGNVTHQVLIGNSTPPSTLAQTISGTGAFLEPMSGSLSGTARYVRVNTTVSPSWVAWREIEIYATLRTDETAVDSFYLGLLEREADPPGYLYYLGQIRAARCTDPNSVHGTLDAITSGFINSPEFVARNLSNEAYVIALYTGLLRRDPDPGGLAYHKNLLDTNAATREQIRQGFVSSVEFAALTVALIMSESCTTV